MEEYTGAPLSLWIALCALCGSIVYRLYFDRKERIQELQRLVSEEEIRHSKCIRTAVSEKLAHEKFMSDPHLRLAQVSESELAAAVLEEEAKRKLY